MSGPPLPALETLLAEVEATAALILQVAELAALDAGVAAHALECCRRIRDALTTGDAAGAGIQLGKRLADLRNLGAIARRAATCKSPAEHAHTRDVQRRREYLTALNRGFSTVDACAKAAAKLGVSPKTIMRAINGH